MTIPTAQGRAWSREAFTGGVMQAVAAAILLFLPTPINCLWGQAPCEPHGYLPYANSTSYILLGVAGVSGLAVAVTSHDRNVPRRCLVRWVGSGINIFLTILTICFGPGLLLLPGTLLMLAAAFLCARKPKSQNTVPNQKLVQET